MLEPLRNFICDCCGGVIEDVADGYVLWKRDPHGRAHDFRIIHYARCDNPLESSSSEALSMFLGQDGLSYLLSFLTVGPIQLRISSSDGPGVVSLSKFVDFIRRVQIPYYEEGRRECGNHEVIERFADSNEYSPYTVESLRDIVASAEAARNE